MGMDPVWIKTQPVPNSPMNQKIVVGMLALPILGVFDFDNTHYRAPSGFGNPEQGKRKKAENESRYGPLKKLNTESLSDHIQ